jgi:predicted dehydrogenase
MMRIGLIGCGTHGKWAILPAMREASMAANLVAVSDLKEANFDGTNVPAGSCYTDYRQMLRNEKLDLVYIATVADSHEAIALDCFKAGLHVICEKPLSISTESCRRMVDAAKKAGKRLVVTFEARYEDHLRKIRDWIDAGYLGRVEAIHMQHFWDGHKNFGSIAERRARLLKIAGALDCGIHKLDAARYFGKGNWKKLFALGAWFGEAFEFPPHIGILGHLDNGVLVTVNASLGFASQIQPRPMNEVLVIAGNKGVISLCIDEPSPEAFHATQSRVHLYSESREESIEVHSPSHSLLIGRMLDDVAKLIGGSELPARELAFGEDGFQAQWATDEANKMAARERIQ